MIMAGLWFYLIITCKIKVLKHVEVSLQNNGKIQFSNNLEKFVIYGYNIYFRIVFPQFDL